MKVCLTKRVVLQNRHDRDQKDKLKIFENTLKQ